MATEYDLPVAKRQKLDVPVVNQREDSRLFAPFRTIGLVSPTTVPFTSTPLGKTTFQITTCVGRCIQTYDLRRGLSLIFISQPQCPQTITASYAYRDKVFVAWGTAQTSRGIWVLKRGRIIQELDISNTIEQEYEQIIVFGVWIVACGPRALEVWRSESGEHYTTILPSGAKLAQHERVLSGMMCTMPTLVNKIFVGRQDGSVDIFNVSTGKLIYSIAAQGSGRGKVTALSATMALSLLAIAYSDGSISIVDVLHDDIILTVQDNEKHRAVTSITFRSDGTGAGDDGRLDGVMATASNESGDITLWDLNKGGKAAGILRGAHEISSGAPCSGINKIEFMPGQPVLISSGMDNSLKSWIFDQVPFSPIPRILHARSGHAAPICNLQFLPAASDGSEAAGKWLLSAGQDHSLWGFSLRRDGQSSELSQGNVKAKSKKLGKLANDQSRVEALKVPPVISMACSLNRDGGMGAVAGPVWTNPKTTNAEETSMTGWESIVTAHQDDSIARTWSWGRKKAGRWAFESGDRRPVTSVAITTCGTFAIIGSAGGALDMYNLQSGMHRQRFPPRLNPSQVKERRIQQLQSEEPTTTREGHHDSITGIIVDSLNRTMISAGLDGQLIFWNFATGTIEHKVTFDGASATAIRYNSVSNLVAIACDDLCVRVLDIDTRKVVRELWGCVGQIYDYCFSHDGRWIVCASMDSVIRIFDLATGHLIDAFKTATCTNVAFSSTGEFLATAHSGSIGINIWNNKSLYTTITPRQINEDSGIIDLTNSSTFDAVSQLAVEDEEIERDVNMEDVTNGSSIDQLDQALLTLSLVPQSRWQTLLNLDVIRERNKPIAPPEKPKAAPFFLGSSMNGTQALLASGNDNIDKPTNDTTREEKSRIAKLTSQIVTSHETALTTLLDTFDQSRASTPTRGDPAAIIAHLSALPPSQADLAIRTLSLAEIPTLIQALTARIQQRRDFELVNTWMAVLLRCHSEFVQVDQVREALVEFKGVMDIEAKRLAELVGWIRGVGEYLRSSR